MRQILFIATFLIFNLALRGQSDNFKVAIKQMDVYWTEPTQENLIMAEEVIADILANESATTQSIPLYLKSQLLTAKLTHEEHTLPDDYEAFLDDLVDTYNKALIYDKNNQNRYHILKRLYGVKDALTTQGAIYYQEKEFQKAYTFYDAASRMNEVEIKFPRIATPDTSTIYSTGVMASLAGKDDLAIKYFERVVELGYYRQDAYDQLIHLYKKNKYDVKAKKMEIKKNKAFPPEQND